jgi:hypothetical protein
MSEESLQMAVARLLDSTGLRWCHVPNGGHRSKAAGGKLKAQGVKRGVPDVLVFNPPFSYEGINLVLNNGLAIELKDGKKGRVSPEQQDWLDGLRECGWRTEVCRSLDEVIDVLVECYPNKVKR